jgi:hypothetical protein
LAAPGTYCANMVGKNGVNYDRSAVPLKGREARLKGDQSFPFVGSVTSATLMKDRSVLARTRERCTRRRASSRRKECQVLMKFGFRSAFGIGKHYSDLTSVEIVKRQVDIFSQAKAVVAAVIV